MSPSLRSRSGGRPVAPGTGRPAGLGPPYPWLADPAPLQGVGRPVDPVPPHPRPHGPAHLQVAERQAARERPWPPGDVQAGDWRCFHCVDPDADLEEQWPLRRYDGACGGCGRLDPPVLLGPPVGRRDLLLVGGTAAAAVACCSTQAPPEDDVPVAVDVDAALTYSSSGSSSSSSSSSTAGFSFAEHEVDGAAPGDDLLLDEAAAAACGRALSGPGGE